MKTRGIPYAAAKQRALKKSDAWTEVLFCDPITLPIAYLLANYTRAHPLHVTLLAFVSRLAAAALFYHGWLLYGGVCAIIGFQLDGIDGKLARILQKDVTLHGTLDFILDQVAFMAMIIGVGLYAIRLGDMQLILLLLLWTIAYFVLMSLISTAMRLRIEAGIKSFTDTSETIAACQVGISKLGKAAAKSIFGKALKTFLGARQELAKYRTIFYPTTIEAQFLLFMVGPIAASVIGTTFSVRVCAGLAILCFIPEIFINIALIWLLIPIAQDRTGK